MFAEGSYRCRILKQNFGRSAVKNTLAFELSFRVLSSLDEPDKKLDEIRTQKFWLTDRTHERVLADLQKIVSEEGYRWPGERISDLDPRSKNYFSMHDWVVVMFCKHRRDNRGKNQEEWSPRDSSLLPVSLSEPAEFDQVGVNSKGEQSSLVVAQEGVSDNDVPF
jgi:hypothetical protein